MVTAERFKILDQNRAESGVDERKALYNPNPQIPTIKLNKLHVVFMIFLGTENNTAAAQLKELIKTTIPEKERKFIILSLRNGNSGSHSTPTFENRRGF